MTITAQRGVFIDADEAEYLCNALVLLAKLLAEQRDQHGHPSPSQPTPRLVATTAKLRRTVDSLTPRDGTADHGQRSEPPAESVSGRALQRNSVDAGPHVVGTAEAAERLGCTPGNVRDLARRGRLAVTRTGTRWRFDTQTLDDYRASQRR